MSAKTIVVTCATKLRRNPAVITFRTICKASNEVSLARVRIHKRRAHRSLFPEDNDALEDEKVRDADRDDGEHRTGEDELLASASRC